MRAAFRWLTSLLFLAIVVQVGLAGYAAFDVIHKAEKASVSVPKDTIENAFNAHSALGPAIVAAMLVLVVISLVGRLGEGPLRWSGGIFLLGVLQFVLGAVSTSVPWLGFLHAVNALAIYAIVAMLAHNVWSRYRRERGAVATQTAAVQ